MESRAATNPGFSWVNFPAQVAATVNTDKVGYEMENRAIFECEIWLRNGSFMVVNILQMGQRNKILNTSSSGSKICKENGQMGCKWNWKLPSERCEYFKSPSFWSDWVESQIMEQQQTRMSRSAMGATPLIFFSFFFFSFLIILVF